MDKNYFYGVWENYMTENKNYFYGVATSNSFSYDFYS